MPAQYVGRFAPSPTGPLHQGSLFAAVASYLDARANDGQWLLRIEDVDQLRCVPGAAQEILSTLEQHGLYWDGPVHYQAGRDLRYQQALEQLAALDLVYYCNCSRKQLRLAPGPYPGHCRARRQASYRPASRSQPASHAIRFDTRAQGHQQISWKDGLLGRVELDLETLGDFILRRRDSLFAYQLAVVVDDIDQQVTRVVRGRDLLESTPWQLLLFEALGATAPGYSHLPLLTHASDHSKLSKQTGATPVNDNHPAANLVAVLGQLGQPVEQYGPGDSPEQILEQATRNWQPGLITKKNIEITGS